MPNLEYAKRMIEEAQSNNEKSLQLDNLNLTSEDLSELLPIIIDKIPDIESLFLKNNKLTALSKEIGTLTNLTELSLDNNQLTALPKEIGTLTNLTELSLNNNKLTDLPTEIKDLPSLTVLWLNNNQLSPLPEGISNLPNLKKLFLDYNSLTDLPAGIGNLSKLEYLRLNDNLLTYLPTETGNLSKLEKLFLESNQLTTLPEEIGNLPKLEKLSLNNNPLSDETISWCTNTLNGIALIDMAAFDQLQNYKNVLEKMYGEQESKTILKKIEGINSGSFETSVEPNEMSENALLTGKEVVTKFLEKVPISGDEASNIYISSAKHLIDQILNDTISEDDRNTILQNIATSLGNCSTPVKSFLIQSAIGQHIDENGNIDSSFLPLIAREAVEAKIVTELSGEFHKDEKIEQIQGLVNALFLEDAEKIIMNKVKIDGDRDRLPSKTAYPIFAFEQVRDGLAKAFAEMVCKVGNNQELEQPDNTYRLDPQKLRAITEPYLAGLGIISQREKYVNNYKQIMGNLEDYKGLAISHQGNNDVNLVLDVAEQQNELRTLLMETTDNQVENEYNKYLNNQINKVSKLAQKYDGNQKTKSKKKPSLNEHRLSSQNSQSSKKNSMSKSL